MLSPTVNTVRPFLYWADMRSRAGHTWTVSDPYSLPSLLGDLDRHLFSSGNHYELHQHLGAHTRINAGIAGVQFAVWAPNAKRVSVVGPFNQWDGRTNTK